MQARRLSQQAGLAGKMSIRAEQKDEPKRRGQQGEAEGLSKQRGVWLSKQAQRPMEWEREKVRAEHGGDVALRVCLWKAKQRGCCRLFSAQQAEWWELQPEEKVEREEYLPNFRCLSG